MKKLLFKYVFLNKKNVMVGFGATIIFSLIGIDGHRYYPAALMMCPALLFSFVVGKMCYLEDSTATQQFLFALPVAKKDIIFEKNIMSYICIIAGLVVANLTECIIDMLKMQTMYFDISLILIMGIFLILYNTIYIFLNYKYDYSKTQFTPYILLGVMLVLFKFGGEVGRFMNDKYAVWWGIGVIGAVFLNIFILQKLSDCK